MKCKYISDYIFHRLYVLCIIIFLVQSNWLFFIFIGDIVGEIWVRSDFFYTQSGQRLAYGQWSGSGWGYCWDGSCNGWETCNTCLQDCGSSNGCWWCNTLTNAPSSSCWTCWSYVCNSLNSTFCNDPWSCGYCWDTVCDVWEDCSTCSDCDCDNGEFCSNWVCESTCTPNAQSAACNAMSCGIVSNGCEWFYNCGSCWIDETCNSGACVCDGVSCQWIECWMVTNICGSNLQCGNCNIGESCNDRVCDIASCSPDTCTSLWNTCGSFSDWCWGVLNCESCSIWETCTEWSCVCPTPDCTWVECWVINNTCWNIATCGSCDIGEACSNNVCQSIGSCISWATRSCGPCSQWAQTCIQDVWSNMCVWEDTWVNVCWWCGIAPDHDNDEIPDCEDTCILSQQDCGSNKVLNQTTCNCDTMCDENYQAWCYSSTNNCWYKNIWSIQCDGVCSAERPEDIIDCSCLFPPSWFGDVCVSITNNCWERNTWTTQCDGTCSAHAPDDSSNVWEACFSQKNSCGESNPWTVQCDGTCDATIPPDKDTDTDNILDCFDECPTDENKIFSGICWCDYADIDTDGDGIADCLDECPIDASKVYPWDCGCHMQDIDTDGDGVSDCNDICLYNWEKVFPGICGCDTVDGDSDFDGILNCLDTEDCDGKDNDGDGSIDEWLNNIWTICVWSSDYSVTASIIFGCLDILACNFDAVATSHDNSCVYPDGCSARCPWDVTWISSLDDCGICDENSDNDNNTCRDCAWIPNGNSFVDSCWQCKILSDPTFNKGCIDCSEKPNGNKIIDACGQCLEPWDFLFDICLDCVGLAWWSALPGSECNDGSILTLDDTRNSSCECVGTEHVVSSGYTHKAIIDRQEYNWWEIFIEVWQDIHTEELRQIIGLPEESHVTIEKSTGDENGTTVYKVRFDDDIRTDDLIKYIESNNTHKYVFVEHSPIFKFNTPKLVVNIDLDEQITPYYLNQIWYDTLLDKLS